MLETQHRTGHIGWEVGESLEVMPDEKVVKRSELAQVEKRKLNMYLTSHPNYCSSSYLNSPPSGCTGVDTVDLYPTHSQILSVLQGKAVSSVGTENAAAVTLSARATKLILSKEV
jgi:hypothetical protein